ncbi:hypothetical protein [Candidatus Nitronereus thalassa]|uniref:Cyclic nucleotide-binding domain-containing protein n=1 Tax=Candidatus Nitronereus thalassa TaxID=3020898 RepID=A0ABU3K8H7_9BACT|nr:hypothetical protein [Candidatus Nitronereus thalassa]MDT7042745.1 hypothetical protein [Candidatus Nitronereus thalassa]
MRKARNFTPRFMVTAFVAGVFLCPSGFSLAAGSSVDDRIQKLEQRIEQMQKQVQQPRHIDWEEVEKRLEKLERQQPASQGGETGNMVFFRGGGAFATGDRSGEVLTDVGGASGFNKGDNGYYIGAGLDLVLSKDVWGMLSKTWVLGEIGVEYKRFNSSTVRSATSTLTGVGNLTTKVEITQLTVSVSPKILFMEGSRLRPWIIPVGLDFHVISPPSGDITVLDVGAQFAVGAQYRVWKALHIGVDGRFHLAAGETDTDNSFGTVGGYMGLAF